MLKGTLFFLIMVVCVYGLIANFPLLPKETKQKTLKVTLQLLGISLFVFIIALSLTLIF